MLVIASGVLTMLYCTACGYVLLWDNAPIYLTAAGTLLIWAALASIKIAAGGLLYAERKAAYWLYLPAELIHISSFVWDKIAIAERLQLHDPWWGSAHSRATNFPYYNGLYLGT